MEKHAQRVPISQRGGEVIEPLVSALPPSYWISLHPSSILIFLSGDIMSSLKLTIFSPILPQVSSQWFVKMDGMAEQALDVVRKGELKILPEMFEKVW